jgi:hypothetical protein
VVFWSLEAADAAAAWQPVGRQELSSIEVASD